MKARIVYTEVRPCVFFGDETLDSFLVSEDGQEEIIFCHGCNQPMSVFGFDEIVRELGGVK